MEYEYILGLGIWLLWIAVMVYNRRKDKKDDYI